MADAQELERNGGELNANSESETCVKVNEMANETTAKPTEKETKKSKKGKDAEHLNRGLVQSLSSLQSPEEKIVFLSKKYSELMGEHKTLQKDVKVQQKRYTTLQRERDHLQSEHGRAVLAKSKLESLCRELQRHNKTIKEESLQRTKEEEEKRKEVSAKFQQTINDITTQMQDNHTRNLKLKEENLDLATKLKSLVEQYERREEHVEKLFKHKELESQLYDAKIQQANIALVEEKDKSQREKAMLRSDVAEYQLKCEVLTKQEVELKAQLTVYADKFEEFQTTLTKSNEVFQTFKQEMDKMTKKIKKLETETNMWRVRWENSNKSLLAMAEQKTQHERELGESRNKVTRLEKLCRALQAERNALLDKERTSTCSDSPKESSVQASDVKTPDVKTPDVKSSDVKSSDVKSSDVNTSDGKSSDVKASDGKSSDGKSLDIDASNDKASDVDTSDIKASDVQASESAPDDQKKNAKQLSDKNLSES